MRRLLFLVMVTGLLVSAGCKEDKTIAPKEVPPAPKGPPIGGGKPGQDGPAEKPKTNAPVISP